MDIITEIISSKKLPKVDYAQQKMIEGLIESESQLLREKLYEAVSKPFNGSKREFEVNFTLAVFES